MLFILSLRFSVLLSLRSSLVMWECGIMLLLPLRPSLRSSLGSTLGSSLRLTFSCTLLGSSIITTLASSTLVTSFCVRSCDMRGLTRTHTSMLDWLGMEEGPGGAEGAPEVRWGGAEVPWYLMPDEG